MAESFDINQALKPEKITDEELSAVQEWISREQDHLLSPLKEGLLKLINNERERRSQGFVVNNNSLKSAAKRFYGNAGADQEN